MKLVLNQQARVDAGKRVKLAAEPRAERRRPALGDRVIAREAQLSAVAADRRHDERSEQPVERGDGPAADEGHRAAGLGQQIPQRRCERAWHNHAVGHRGKI
jgi:hypothetical protein